MVRGELQLGVWQWKLGVVPLKIIYNHIIISCHISLLKHGGPSGNKPDLQEAMLKRETIKLFTVVKPWPNDANIYPNKCQHCWALLGIVGHCWALLDVGWPNEPNIGTQHLSAYHSNACSYLGPRLLNFQIV